MIKFDKAPEKLVEKGIFNFGVYNSFIENINPLDADIYKNRVTPKFIKDTSLKEWHAYQFGDNKFLCLLILMNLKKTSMVEIVIYDIERKSSYKYLINMPLGTVDVAKDLKNSTVFYKDESIVVEILNSFKHNKMSINFSWCNGDDECIKCSVEGDTSTSDPFISCMPLEGNRGIYTHKQPMFMKGSLMINGELHRFNQDQSYLIVDDQKAYYSYHFWWNWLSSSKIVDGKLTSINLTENQCTNPKKYNENCIWLDGVVYRLPEVRFLFDRRNSIWKIIDAKGKVDLTFKPVFKNRIDRNIVIARSDYFAPFGWLNGTVDLDGVLIDINDFFAMGEKIDVKL